MTLARSSASPIAPPTMATSVWLTALTVTVTVDAPTATSTPTGRMVIARSTAARAAAAGCCRHRGCPGPFAGGELDRQLIAGHERNLDESEHQHRDQRETQRELDGRLTGIVQTRSITESMTRSKRSADLAGSTASGGPADHEQGDECGGEQHQRVLGGRLAAVGAQARARVGRLGPVELVQQRRVEAGEQQ